MKSNLNLIIIGRGAYGIVERVIHTESQFEMALKRITAVSQEGKRFLMVVYLNSNDWISL